MKLRNRILKPEFFQNEDLAKLKPHARLLFQGLWCAADREGRLDDNATLIKGYLFPYELSVNIENLLKILAETNFIVRYSVQNSAYIWIPTFKDHQKLHPNETQSVIPLPDDVIKWYDNVIKLNDIGEPLVPQCSGTSSSSFTFTSTSTCTDAEPSEKIPYQEIIDHLNKITGKNYKSKSDSKNGELIRARWNEGFRLNDFKRVHIAKYGDPFFQENNKLLRPSTLYAKCHFEDYLNEKVDTWARDKNDNLLLPDSVRQTVKLELEELEAADGDKGKKEAENNKEGVA